MSLQEQDNAGREEFHVEQRQHAMLFRKEMRFALMAGQKDHTRRIVTPANSNTNPGSFGDVQWDTGRVKRQGSEPPYLRVQCEFPRGGHRVVSVTPKMLAGDLIWVRDSRYMQRAKSQLTLRVTSVDICRVRDMTDAQALAEGVLSLPPSMRKKGTPRDWFARLWDDINGPGAWERNDWVWDIGLHTHVVQIDQLIYQEGLSNGPAANGSNTAQLG